MQQQCYYFPQHHLYVKPCGLVLLVRLLVLLNVVGRIDAWVTTTVCYPQHASRLLCRRISIKAERSRHNNDVLVGIEPGSSNALNHHQDQHEHASSLTSPSLSLSSTSNGREKMIPEPFWSELQKLRSSNNNSNDDADNDQPLLSTLKADGRRGQSWSEAKRVFHGRGGCFPGCEHLTLDWYPPVWVLTSFGVDLSHEVQTQVGTILRDLVPSPVTTSTTTSTTTIETFSGTRTSTNTLDDPRNDAGVNQNKVVNLVYQLRNGKNSTTTLVSGIVPDPHIVSEHGLQYYVKVLKNQNHGLFLDMANGRAWLQHNAKDCKVLNLFAYTCGFSVAAIAGDAKEVINVDMARGALKTGQRNHELLQASLINHQNPDPHHPSVPKPSLGKVRFLAHDIFKSWGKLKRLGPYNIVVVDPPSFQKGSFVVKKDYPKLIRRLPSLIDSDGYVLLCLNAPELDETYLQEQVAIEAPTLEFVERIPNPSTFPVKDPSRSLKNLLFRNPSCTANNDDS